MCCFGDVQMFRDVLDADAGASFIFVISQKSHQANTSYSDAKDKNFIFAHLLICWILVAAKPFFIKASQNKNQVYSEDCGLHRTQNPLDPKKQQESIAVAPPVSSRKESPDVNNSLPIPTLPLWILWILIHLPMRGNAEKIKLTWKLLTYLLTYLPILHRFTKFLPSNEWVVRWLVKNNHNYRSSSCAAFNN